MTTATKQVPVKSQPTPVATPPSAASVAAPKAVLDFSQVSATLGGEDEKVVSKRSSALLDSSPVRGWVRQSRDNGDRLVRVKVPTASIEAIKNLIHRAASELPEVGARFGTALAVKDEPGFSVLPFQTKDKKKVDMSAEAVAKRAATRAANKAAKAAGK